MIFSVILASYFNHLSLQESARSSSNIMYAVSQNIRTYLDDLQRLSLTYNIYPDIMRTYKYINAGKYDNITNAFEYNQIYNKYRIIMQDLLNNTRSDITGVVFIPYRNPHTLYVVSRTDTSLRTYKGNNSQIEGWMNSAIINKGAPVFSSVHTVDYYNGKSETVFSIVCLVKDVYNRDEKVGVMTPQVENLRSFLRMMSPTRTVS